MVICIHHFVKQNDQISILSGENRLLLMGTLCAQHCEQCAFAMVIFRVTHGDCRLLVSLACFSFLTDSLLAFLGRTGRFCPGTASAHGEKVGNCQTISGPSVPVCCCNGSRAKVAAGALSMMG